MCGTVEIELDPTAALTGDGKRNGGIRYRGRGYDSAVDIYENIILRSVAKLIYVFLGIFAGNGAYLDLVFEQLELREIVDMYGNDLQIVDHRIVLVVECETRR